MQSVRVVDSKTVSVFGWLEPVRSCMSDPGIQHGGRFTSGASSMTVSMVSRASVYGLSTFLPNMRWTPSLLWHRGSSPCGSGLARDAGSDGPDAIAGKPTYRMDCTCLYQAGEPMDAPVTLSQGIWPDLTVPC